MYEVLEVGWKVVLLLGLFYMAWVDYRTKLIEGKCLLLLGIMGGLSALLQGESELVWQAFYGMLLGVVLLLLAWISKESIGVGDGLLFVVTGIFLGFLQNFVLLFGSMLLAGIFALGCLGLKKKGRDDRVALVPFVLISYVLFVL